MSDIQPFKAIFVCAMIMVNKQADVLRPAYVALAIR